MKTLARLNLNLRNLALLLAAFPCYADGYLKMSLPGNSPELFAPGIVSTQEAEHGSIAVAPDGKSIYWSRRLEELDRQWVIMTSKLIENRWTPPEIASFSFKGYSSSDPSFSSDGNYLFFHSDYPVETDKNRLPNIWYVKKDASGWLSPKPVSDAVNNYFAANPAMSLNQQLYFTSIRDDTKGKFDIYYSDVVDGQFLSPVNLGSSINSKFVEARATISPDDSYLIFWSIGRSDSLGSGDLYISFRDNHGGWKKAVNMGPAVNSKFNDSFPSISADGKYLFFMSNRNGNDDIYWLALSELIDTYFTDEP
ncbi:PD40 domain-containing protein [Aliikangiella sp. G2MR2-5]|uniref:TolB family protein n=1 Tax=Aliikangiella sp. G2MR2-5 TaxID=2788943 RepID=UPI0018A91537|nr:PD40 domain-containing protein [Aliikangiella sp. G2MR2-5]